MKVNTIGLIAGAIAVASTANIASAGLVIGDVITVSRIGATPQRLVVANYDSSRAWNASGVTGGSNAEAATVVVKQLDDHLLLRYSTDPGVLTELFFKCGSVKHKFVLGKNPTMETWDPDDEFLYAEKAKKKKRHEKTFEAVLPLPSGPKEGEDYTNADQLQDIASLGAAMEQLTQALNANGV